MAWPDFADEVQAGMTPGFTLPDEFRRLFAWMEPNGFVRTYDRTPGRYAALYPGQLADEAGSTVAFVVPDPEHMRHWLGIEDPALTGRVTTLIRTGGEGSMAGLWRDDAGRQRFVHLGSGSGSVLTCVLTDDPVDMLRFLAIGYTEACWPEVFDKTPAEAAGESWFADSLPPYLAPVQFQAWVSETFGVTIPARASEIVPLAPGVQQGNPDDPFLLWLDALHGQ